MSVRMQTATEIDSKSGNGTTHIDADQLGNISRDELKELGRLVSQDAMESAIDFEARPVEIKLDGRIVWAKPLDTRRFMQEMAPHICFN